MSKKLGGLGLNGIKLKWIIGTHGNWKNQKSWSYQLDSTANLAHLPKEWAMLYKIGGAV